ncbi:hypothetical protein ACMFFK_04315 [Serratia marcescens]|uniref:hypothetical protein n=1 Tax=Serratia TaxID=613 RepID=UPI0015D677A2|nr:MULTISPECIES: hypothetical protein [Serratia]MBJ2089990.1 hypothetical protein [Serratia ureilytica]MBN3987618.1 hypothetical protein [Serratia marcescens]MCX2173124.1 hypothetical protein [Serratia marcescens]MCX2177255.1 hypothetical protein [Serratia marcescens]QLJ58500.1 hypothetical protein HP475_00405 [Serratia marcescens]
MIDNGSLPTVACHVFSSWNITLVDACSFGRLGLEAALLKSASPFPLKVRGLGSLVGPISVMSPFKHADKEHRTREERCLVVRLPEPPQEAMLMLLSLGDVPLDIYSHVLVMSSVNPAIIRRFLLGVGVNRHVRILDDRLPISALCEAIIPSVEQGSTSSVTWFGEMFHVRLQTLFTPGERRALWYVLKGVSMYQQVLRSQVSNKTLYNQRHTALIKLRVRGVNDLIRQFLFRRKFLQNGNYA